MPSSRLPACIIIIEQPANPLFAPNKLPAALSAAKILFWVSAMNQGKREFLKRLLGPGLLFSVLGVMAQVPGKATVLKPCVGGDLPVETFSLQVMPPEKHAKPLPLGSVNRIREGDRLKYALVDLPPALRDKAKIALVLVPSPHTTEKNLVVLGAKAAAHSAEWDVPMRSSAVGVVFGPRGLDVKKISDLVNRDPELIPELATYAKQTATVNALISTLSQYDQSKPGTEDLNAVLKGFSTRYGVMLPRLDTSAPASEQAQQLLQALVPTVSGYNPMNSGRGLVMQQSAGVAASLAALFYGTPVGLAAGGAALIEGLRTMIFPNTDLRAAFVEPTSPSNDLELCSHNVKPEAHSRLAYLWMLRIPDVNEPSVFVPAGQNIPMGVTSDVKVTCATHEQLRILTRARGWQLVSGSQRASVPAKIKVGAQNDTLSLDLANMALPAGAYHLEALWDWQRLGVQGSLNVVPLGNLTAAALTPQTGDRLVQGSGPVKAKLVGADFEFVKKVVLESSVAEDGADGQQLAFTLPRGPAEGTQLSLETMINTSKVKAGHYNLLLTQTNGKAAAVPVTIHPPEPKFTNVPVRINLGQPKQEVTLQGEGLERVDSLKSPDAVWTLAPVASGSSNVTERKAEVHLKSSARQGELINAMMSVEGINQTVPVMGLAIVAGPRPEIQSVDVSFSNGRTVALDKGEIPAGAPVSFAIHLAHAGASPKLKLACTDQSLTRDPVSILPGSQDGSAHLDFAGAGVLFLSVDPGVVGQSGCDLTAQVEVAKTGTSDPYPLGKVVQLPQIVKFSLSNEKIGRSLYSGVLTGENLQVISMTGWNSRRGYSVQGIPTPVPDNSGEQTLKIELPWPPPSPGAPVYIWLRGEDKGRATTATY